MISGRPQSSSPSSRWIWFVVPTSIIVAVLVLSLWPGEGSSRPDPSVPRPASVPERRGVDPEDRIRHLERRIGELEASIREQGRRIHEQKNESVILRSMIQRLEMVVQ